MILQEVHVWVMVHWTMSLLYNGLNTHHHVLLVLPKVDVFLNGDTNNFDKYVIQLFNIKNRYIYKYDLCHFKSDSPGMRSQFPQCVGDSLQNILVACLGQYPFGEVLQMCSLVKASLVRGTSRPGLVAAEPSGCAQLEA